MEKTHNRNDIIVPTQDILMTDEVPLATAEPFRVPTAPCRPGDESSFPEWKWTPEDLSSLPIDCSAEETEEHAYGLLRVLDDDGNAGGEWTYYLCWI